jgi:putative transposase
MDVSMMARMKELEDENQRLEKMLIYEKLKAEIAAEARQKVVRLSQPRQMAKQVVTERGIAVSLACARFAISPSCYRYVTKLASEHDEIADPLTRLTHHHRNWRFGLCYLYQRNVKGFPWNQKRVYRMYRALALTLKIKPRK